MYVCNVYTSAQAFHPSSLYELRAYQHFDPLSMYTYSYCMYSTAKDLQTRALNLAPYANVLKMVTRSATMEILAEKK